MSQTNPSPIWAILTVAVIGVLAGVGFAAMRVGTDQTPVQAKTETTITPVDKKERKAEKVEKATFGAGCFWGVEVTFRNTPGVVDAAVGYEGGTTAHPTYEQVCTDRTGHAEVVEVDFDPTKVSYEQLVKVFFENHNPTQLNYQGPDHGTQYRSAIFYHSPEQKAVAEKVKAELSAGGKFTKPIVTEITPATDFWKAEDYHQNYLQKRGLASCHILR